MPNIRPRNHRGFTLVEMAIVLMIVGIIAVFVLPPLMDSIRQGKNREAKAGLESLKDQIIGYALDHGQLPEDLTVLGSPRDPYLRPYRYVANPAISEYNAQAELICDASTDSSDANYVGSPVLRVLDKDNSPVDFVAFVVASDGRDQQADIDLAAPHVNSTLPIYSTSGWNKDVDLFNDTDGDGMPDPYDDLVQYATLLELKALFQCGSTSAGGGGGGGDTTPDPDPQPLDETILHLDSPPIYNPGIINGYGYAAVDGYTGIVHGTSVLSDGGDGRPSTLATRMEVRCIANPSYNMEVLTSGGSLGTYLSSGEVRLNENFLFDNRLVPLDFEMSYNITDTDQISWTVAGRTLTATLPSVASGKVRLLGNFWITANVWDPRDDLYVEITEINNYGLPDPPTLHATGKSADYNDIFLSQRTYAVEDLLIRGTITLEWKESGSQWWTATPNSSDCLYINFEVHDVPIS